MYNLQESAPTQHAFPAAARSHSDTPAKELSNSPDVIIEATPFQASQSSVFDGPDTKAANRLASTLQYMLAHLNQPIDISTLSEMAGFSRSRFFELFKSATGDTPINWFIRARMQWASELLSRTNMRIKQIAWHVGYEDQFYFSRLFKAVHGISPSEYRGRRVASAVNPPGSDPARGAALAISAKPLARDLLGAMH